MEGVRRSRHQVPRQHVSWYGAHVIAPSRPSSPARPAADADAYADEAAGAAAEAGLERVLRAEGVLTLGIDPAIRLRRRAGKFFSSKSIQTIFSNLHTKTQGGYH